MTEHIVTTIEDHADVAADGSLVKLHLKTSQGDVTLTMSGDVLSSFAVRTTELFRVVRMRTEKKPDDPLETTVSTAKGIAALPAIGVPVVILSIRDENDLVHRFALHPQQSAQLRPQMRQAEIAATKDAGQTRQ